MFNLAMGARWAGERNRYRKWASKNFFGKNNFIVILFVTSDPQRISLFFGISSCWNEFGFLGRFDELVRVFEENLKIFSHFRIHIFLFSLGKIEDYRVANPLSISLTFIIMINKRITERKKNISATRESIQRH